MMRRRALALHYCSGDTPFEAPGGHVLFAQLGGEQVMTSSPPREGYHHPLVMTSSPLVMTPSPPSLVMASSAHHHPPSW